MIVLHTLGFVAIQIGSRKVLPSATRAFGALLYLVVERGREVPRGELQSLFFPDQGDRAAAHNLRQLLYRVRGLGAPLAARSNAVILPADGVHDDYTAITESGALPPETVKAATDGVLPGYAPSFSRPFAQWVEDQRARIQSDLLRRLTTELSTIRRQGRWREAEPVARACLALDPLNEEATLALAESLALTGQKAGAVQLLDGYLAEIGPYGRELHVPATMLRTRISEYVPNDGYRRIGVGPFVGRDAEMAELWRAYRAAQGGSPRAVVVHGEPGLGKTRLGNELLRAAALDGARSFKIECVPHDIQRPLSVFVDLVPKLLAAPGGLGVAPSAMTQLQRLTQPDLSPTITEPEADPRHLFNLIKGAVTDLVDAVCDEQPVAVLVDDAHAMDPASTELLLELVGGSRSRRCVFVLTSRSKMLEVEAAGAPDAVTWLRLRPLEAEAARELYASLVKSVRRDDAPEPVEERLELAAGNPLFLRWLLMESPTTSRASLPESLTDLLTQRVRRLRDTTLRAFVAAVLLGKHCRLDRLTRLAGLAESDLLNAIQTLESQGFLEAEGADIRSAHPLLSQAALEEFPPVTMRLMHSTAAMMLQAEAEPTHDIAMLWDAAEHWHGAGSTGKAIDLLQSCASYCVQIGQPTVACELLGRAVDLAQPDRAPSLLLQLNEAAKIAEDYELVKATIGQYRNASPRHRTIEPHDELELDEMQAARFAGLSILELLPRLERCIAAPRATAAHKLGAACQLLVAHELTFNHAAAEAAYAAASSVPLQNHDEQALRWRADILYHTFAGNLDQAISSGRQLMEAVQVAPPSAVGVRLAVDASMALFRCGECDPAIDALRAIFERAKKIGMASSLIDISSMIAWMTWILHDEENHAEWDRTADQLYSDYTATHGRVSHYLSNKIEFALDRGDADAASAWLKKAGGSYAEIATPRSRILALAFEMRIDQLTRRQPKPIIPVAEMGEIHAKGRSNGLHDNFVEAYWHELTAAGPADQANAMVTDYVRAYRRDRYPISPPLERILLRIKSDSMRSDAADNRLRG
ncbi:MAG: AAA family ATPase [Gemmatimonadota bacterium]|nr:AAA family ATPase [Gemmatimonadota bacterium]